MTTGPRRRAGMHPGCGHFLTRPAVIAATVCMILICVVIVANAERTTEPEEPAQPAGKNVAVNRG